MPSVKYFTYQKWSPRVTRDVLVLGPDGLILKTTIALHHGGISLNSYSATGSPAISQIPWYD